VIIGRRGTPGTWLIGAFTAGAAYYLAWQFGRTWNLALLAVVLVALAMEVRRTRRIALAYFGSRGEAAETCGRIFNELLQAGITTSVIGLGVPAALGGQLSRSESVVGWISLTILSCSSAVLLGIVAILFTWLAQVRANPAAMCEEMRGGAN
jgi:hypothetical protein